MFCGGGDGTFIGFADEILSEAERAHAVAPRFGVLKLGTGNGLAALVQASPVKDGGVCEDVRRAREGAVPGYRPLELLKVEGRRAQFAGLGLDARLLNDYLGLKARVHGTWGHWALTGARGYALTMGLRTLPHALVRRLTEEVEVRNASEVPAYRLDADRRTPSRSSVRAPSSTGARRCWSPPEPSPSTATRSGCSPSPDSGRGISI